MNRLFALALLSVIGMTVSAAADTIGGGTELIVNGGFEQFVAPEPLYWGGYNLVGWTGGADAELGTYGATHSGDYALHVYSSNTKTQENTYADGFASNVTSLSFSGWGHAQDNNLENANINVVTGNWDGTTFTEHDSLTLSTNNTSWTELTGTLDIRHGTGVNMTNHVKVVLSTVFSDSNFTASLFDDMSLRTSAIPEPSSIVMTLVGLIGLLAYVWRKRK